MGTIRKLYRTVQAFFIRYPAVVSGYIIYSYLFISIIRLYVKVKGSGALLSDAYDIFSALPFMWLLAVSLVKVIDYRTKLHMRDRELQIRTTQIATMHEVTKGIQHKVNNPLAIISLSLSQLKRLVKDRPEAVERITDIEPAVQQIISALKNFAEAERYESEHIDQIVGTIASLTTEQKNPE